MARIQKPTTEIAEGDRLVLMEGTEQERVVTVLEVVKHSASEIASGTAVNAIEWSGLRASGTLSDQPMEDGELPTVTVEVEDEEG